MLVLHMASPGSIPGIPRNNEYSWLILDVALKNKIRSCTLITQKMIFSFLFCDLLCILWSILGNSYMHRTRKVSPYLTTYLLTYLHTYLPTYIHIYLPTYLPTYLTTYLSIYPFIIFLKDNISWITLCPFDLSSGEVSILKSSFNLLLLICVAV